MIKRVKRRGREIERGNVREGKGKKDGERERESVCMRKRGGGDKWSKGEGECEK